MQACSYCTIFDTISTTISVSFKLAVDQISTIAECGDSVIIVTKSRQAYRFNLESSKHIKGTVQPEKLISGVEDVQANRYCVIVLTTDGMIWVSGKDTIKIGILGLGESTFNSKALQMVPTEDPVSMISLTDNYAIALTQHNDILLWGTTLDNFFGKRVITRR